MNVCVICASRGRTTRLDDGHVCQPCLIRIGDQLDDIVRLAALASVDPGTGRGSGRSIPSSRPPLNVDAISPELTLVHVGGANATVLETLESWERLVRDARRMAPYGPVSRLRAITAGGTSNDTGVTLTGVTGFLRASLPWWQTEPEQPIDDFASEVHACQRALTHYDPDREPLGYFAYCPTEGCGARLRYQRADEEITCPRCKAVRDVPTLVAVVMSDPDCRDIWADSITASLHYGVSERRLRQMAVEGKIERKAGRYRITLRKAMA